MYAARTGQTLTRQFFTSMERWQDLAGEVAGRPWLVYGGEERQSREEAEVVPWRAVSDLVAAAVPPAGRP